MIIALATPRVASSVAVGVGKARQCIAEAATGALAVRYAPERYRDSAAS